MNSRVDQDEHPDGRGHVADTSPHAEHGTCVVVSLQGGAPLSLGKDDKSVKDFVELGEVEPPAPEGETFIPEPAHIRGVRQARGTQSDVGVLALPLVRIRVVRHSVTKPPRSMHLAQGIDGTNNRVLVRVVGERVLQAAEHGHAGDGGVDGQKHIVQDDKGIEDARLADAPRLVLVPPVVPVYEKDGGRVYGGNGRGHRERQGAVVDVLRDGERVLERGVVRRRDRWRRGVGRELEDVHLREVTRIHGWAGAGHCDDVDEGSRSCWEKDV